MATSRSDVVIVGGGVIGCAVAYTLAKEHLSVTVLERTAIAAESSGAAAGILAPRIHATDPEMFALALASEQQFGPLVEELRAETGVDVEYAACPGIELAYDEQVDQQLRAKARALASDGHQAAWLEAADVLRLEPAVNPAVRGGLHDTGGTQVHPYRFTQAIAQAAARAGVHFELGVEAHDLLFQARRATAVRTTAGDFEGGEIVLAAGAWTGLWSRALSTPIPVFPARGQILTLTAVPTPIRSVVYAHGVYLMPRGDGTIVLGATYEQVGFDKSVTAGGLGYLLGTAARFCPAIANARFERAWAGLRPGSADEVPLVGRAPGWENVTLATGHYRNGIMLAPVTAAIVADLILGRESDLPIGPLDPARFTASR